MKIQAIAKKKYKKIKKKVHNEQFTYIHKNPIQLINYKICF